MGDDHVAKFHPRIRRNYYYFKLYPPVPGPAALVGSVKSIIFGLMAKGPRNGDPLALSS